MNLPTLTVLLNGTDVTAYVLLLDGYDASRGRAEWQGAVTAGELSLTLNNSDGRFTPGSTVGGGSGFGIGPFGLGPFGSGTSSIAVDASIQLKETVNGTTYTLFTGFVKSWPVAWPATVSTFATVNVTATDAQARAERRTLRSMVEEEILLRSPSAYWPLTEATGATSAGDASTNQAPPLTVTGRGAAPVFGVAAGPQGAEGLTAAQFSAGQYLASTVARGSTYMVFLPITRTAAPAALEVVAVSGSEMLAIDTFGKIGLYTNASGTPISQSPTSICDGAEHLVGWAIAPGLTHGYRFFADTYADSSASGFGTPAATGTLSVAGPANPTLASFGYIANAFAGTASHVVLLDGSYLSDVAFTTLVSVMSGSLSESGTARLSRLAGYAGLTVGTLDPSLTTVPAQATNGQSAMDAIQAVSDAELGTTYIDGSGALVFHNRNRVVAKTSPDLTLDHQYVTPDVQPTVDDQQIVNYFEATASGTGSVQSVLNAASDTAHGRYPTAQTYLVRTDQEALDRANWIVANFAEPSVRFGTLTINLANMTPALASTVLAAIDLDCWLRLTSMGSQTPGGTTVDVVVEGLRYTRNADTWTIACNVVSHSLYAPVWVLGTSALGVDTRLYV